MKRTRNDTPVEESPQWVVDIMRKLDVLNDRLAQQALFAESEKKILEAIDDGTEKLLDELHSAVAKLTKPETPQKTPNAKQHPFYEGDSVTFFPKPKGLGDVPQWLHGKVAKVFPAYIDCRTTDGQVVRVQRSSVHLIERGKGTEAPACAPKLPVFADEEIEA
jgi:hypothetical protein